ncbi:DUF4244 domain-containing protein [Saccharothrix syringae]|uniref:DUF4244 domain-containing protein n=1 Tax=Saccharothrix syringae TaxID=103733 RepID=A0A5Q0GS46_SACSY|nr:DUF4244 domain-containing protein [Saccharothrix syringae]
MCSVDVLSGWRSEVLDDSGTSTVEYAIVLLAAAGLAMVLFAVMSSDWILAEVQGMVRRAFTVNL